MEARERERDLLTVSVKAQCYHVITYYIVLRIPISYRHGGILLEKSISLTG